ncbi:MAG: RusA family crossover junction endodeoxyribonuclease [Veillonella sp.]|jgi:crossover junction endodeoxyribonuclease rusA superfamily|uniref:RusA family crossover junction endodeoxyribonuclease n=1 Tax=Veillonella sp. TaxID=1926307 RepID=UPI002064A49B|nr:RusA family crossover junction endodeoxyribonuclease [Veillonella sp.]MBS5407430.1 RusA family crossover junction endodeoxyribonuclease [Veillonella sp.]DAR15564.1 MAG TPA: Endodeoxyribonuclease RusA [Caudoviricetes sp.]
MSVIDIVFKGRPITKKNHGQIVKRGNKLGYIQSEAYRNYEDACLWQLAGKKLHISGIVVVECKYYLPNKRSWPDLIGLLQATSDILTKAKVIDDDKWICSYGDSCIAGIDKENPRVEIRIMDRKNKVLEALLK